MQISDDVIGSNYVLLHRHFKIEFFTNEDSLETFFLPERQYAGKPQHRAWASTEAYLSHPTGPE